MRRRHGRGRDSLAMIGPLEAEVLNILWTDGACGARNVFETMRDRGERVAYTTIATVLGNLHRKKLVGRRRDGRTYIYRPLVGRNVVLLDVLRRIRRALAEGEDAMWRAVSEMAVREER